MSGVTLTRFAAKGRAWLRSKRGTAALEFGLASPLLVVMIVGLVEVGMAAYEAMQVQNAAEAGAIYATQNPTDLVGVATAVVNATGTTGITASPAPSAFCGCPGAAGITVGNCVTVCASGSAQGHYVRVNASYTHVPILTFIGLPDPLVLAKQSTIRVQ